MPHNHSVPTLPTDGRRILWLVFERPPHPEAVSYPADADEVRLVLSLLAYPYARRMDIVTTLRNILAAMEHTAPCERPTIPARLPSGLYRLISWRFAKWLANVLAVEGSAQRRVQRELQGFLASGRESNVFSALSRNGSTQGGGGR